MSTSTILSVSRLSAGYDGKKAVADLSFSLKEGEILCLVGDINDIDVALKPIKEKYFGEDKDNKPYSVEDIYEAIRKTAEGLTDSIKEDLLETYHTASEIFPDAKGDDEEMLTMFSFITLLVLDVYIKKLLIEKLIDGYSVKLGLTKSKDGKNEK